MKALLNRRPPLAPVAADAAEDEQERKEEGAGGWSWSTGAAANAAVLLRWAAWGLMLLGPLLGAAALLSRPASAGPTRSQSPVSSPATGGQGAAGFAQLFLAAFISAGDGDQAKLAAYYPSAADLRLEGAPGRRSGDQLAVVRLRQIDPNVWSVTVAVRITTAAASSSAGSASPAADGTGAATAASPAAAGSVHYFQVPVATAPAGGGATGYVALSMPAEVAGPARVQVPALVYGPMRPALPGDPLTGAVTEFLTAYLTGVGDLGRYLLPRHSVDCDRPVPVHRAGRRPVGRRGRAGRHPADRGSGQRHPAARAGRAARHRLGRAARPAHLRPHPADPGRPLGDRRTRRRPRPGHRPLTLFLTSKEYLVHNIVLADGWIATFTGLGNAGKALIFTVLIPALCGLFVLVVGFRTKSPGPTIMACILAAIVWGLSANMGTLQGKAVQDINQYNGGTTTSSVQRGDQ